MPSNPSIQVPAPTPSLVRGMSWSVLGQAVSAISQWGVLVILIKHLSPEQVGEFALALAIVGPLFAFSNLQLAGLLASDQTRDFSPATYVVLRLITSLSALTVVSLLAVTGIAGEGSSAIVCVIGVTKLFEAASDLMYGFLQQRDRVDQVGRLQCARGLVTVSCASGAILLASTLWSAIIGIFVGQLLLTACVDAVVLRRRYPETTAFQTWHPAHVAWPEVRRLAFLALPMGAVIGLNLLTVNLPRYWLAATLGTASVGIYAALSYVMTGGSMAIGAIGQAAVPRLARLYQSDPSAYRALLLRLTIPAITAGVAGVALAGLAGESILALLYNQTFASYVEPFVWIMIGAGLSYLSSMAGCALTAARIFRSQAWLTCAATLSTAIASALFIPRWQLVGAAWALCVGYTVKLIGQSLVLRRTGHVRAAAISEQQQVA